MISEIANYFESNLSLALLMKVFLTKKACNVVFTFQSVRLESFYWAFLISSSKIKDKTNINLHNMYFRWSGIGLVLLQQHTATMVNNHWIATGRSYLGVMVGPRSANDGANFTYVRNFIIVYFYSIYFIIVP